jgi:SAM-dependent methyltransferase
MSWTQFPGEGPGDELLGDVKDLSVVELGCGAGDSLAYLAARGAYATGIDSSGNQVERAATRWAAEFPGRIRFLHGDASVTLARLPVASVDIGYSIFGAIGYSDPVHILRQLRAVLRGEGKVVFAVRHPRWPYPMERPTGAPSKSIHGQGRRCVMLQITDSEAVPVVRYCYSVQGWLDLCVAAGYIVRASYEISVEPRAMEKWYQGDELQSMIHSATEFPCTLVIVAVPG